MYRSLVVAPLAVLCLVASPVRARAAEDDPTVAGKRASEWIKILDKDNDPKARRRAADNLATVGTRAPDLIAPALANALRNDPETDVRRAAVSALRSMGPAALEGMKAVAEALKDDKDPRVRQTSAAALGRMIKQPNPRQDDIDAVKPALPILLMALKDEHAGTRAAAAESLGRFGPTASEATSQLLEIVVKDSDRHARSYAAFALVRVGASADRVVPTLTELLGKEETTTEIREVLIDVLAEYGPKAAAAVSELAKALKAKEVSVRSKAAVALGKVGPDAKAAVSALRDLLKDAKEDKTVRCFAVRALGAIGKDGKDAVPDLIKCLRDDNLEVRLAAIEELGQMGPDAKEAVPELNEAVKDGREAVRKAAREALRKILEM